MWFVTLVGTVVCTTAFGQTPVLTDMGTLPGASTAVGPALSADGATDIGTSTKDGGDRVFRWTAAEGMIDLGSLPGNAVTKLPSWAAPTISLDGSGVNQDGSVVLVNSRCANCAYGQAAIWTSSGGLASIGAPLGSGRAEAAMLSMDGTTAVGRSIFTNGVGGHAFRWRAAGGMQELGVLGGAAWTGATATSADGSVVVGYSGDFAFRWTEAGGMQDLGALPGYSKSAALFVSDDGSVVVGCSYASGNDRRAFRWTTSGGMEALGLLPGDDRSLPEGLSADGSVVSGFTYPANTTNTGQYHHLLWTAGGGITNWEATAGIGFPSTRAFSANGNAIVGTGVFGGASHAFRWTSSAGTIDLGSLPFPTGWTSFGEAVNADGSVVAGVWASSSPDSGVFRWTSTEGMVSIGRPLGSYSVGHAAINRDGDVVLGEGVFADVPRGFRRTTAAGMVELPPLSGAAIALTSQPATAVSATGAFVVGASASANGPRACRWDADGLPLNLGVLAGGASSQSRGVSADGSVVVGDSDSSSGVRAFRWSSGSGMVSLGVLPGTVSSSARGTNSDGSVVVGSCGVSGGDPRAFRWTSAGMQDLGLAPGSTGTAAYAVSADGSVIVGTIITTYSGIGQLRRPFRWTAAAGLEDLGLPVGSGSLVEALAISADGEVVVGRSGGSCGALLWTRSLGAVSLCSLIQSMGVDTTGWTLTSATGVSFDGSSIVGEGIHDGQYRNWKISGLSIPHGAGVVDMSNLACWDPYADPSNVVRTFDVAMSLGLAAGTPCIIRGFGYDVDIETITPTTYLSDVSIAFGTPEVPGAFAIAPGTGFTFPGHQRFSGNGLTLSNLGTPNLVLPTGVLRLELYNEYRNNENDVIDAYLRANSSITLQGGALTACGQWMQLAPTASPPARVVHSMAYDPIRNKVLLYGGLANGQALADFWSYDGVNWTLISANAAPGRRRSAMMAWDAQSQQIVLFGGYDDNTGTYLRDNWGWNGTQWTPLHTFPSAREGGALAQGPDLPNGRHTLVLYGGGNCCGYFNETWIWDGVDWSQASPPGSAGQLINFFMAYDSVRHRTVLFGGNNNGSGVVDDTYEWDGTTWLLRATSGPSARAGAVMWFDTLRSRVVLFGGHNSNASPSNYGDTWEWDGTQWVPVPVPGPAARDAAAGAFNSQSGQAVIFGGTTNGTNFLQDTWTYRATLGPAIATQPEPARACRTGSASFVVAVTGGGTITYQWRKAGANVANSFGHITGAQTAALTISNVVTSDAGNYDCVIVDDCGSATSNPAMLTICAADINCSDTLTVQDIFDFLSAYFSGSPAADFNGVGGATVQDIFDFLAAYFAGCN